MSRKIMDRLSIEIAAESKGWGQQAIDLKAGREWKRMKQLRLREELGEITESERGELARIIARNT